MKALTEKLKMFSLFFHYLAALLLDERSTMDKGE